MPAFQVIVRRGEAWFPDLYVARVLPAESDVIFLADGRPYRVLAIGETNDGAPLIECVDLDDCRERAPGSSRP